MFLDAGGVLPKETVEENDKDDDADDEDKVCIVYCYYINIEIY